MRTSSPAASARVPSRIIVVLTRGAENQWVNPRTGAMVDNPIPGPNGQMLDPNTREPLVNRAAQLNQLNGAGNPQGGGTGNTGINPRAPGGIFGGRGLPGGLPGRGGIR